MPDEQVAQSETPEEIAERVTNEWYQTAGATAVTLADAILSALRNERERCALIAANHVSLTCWCPERIATAIREGR